MVARELINKQIIMMQQMKNKDNVLATHKPHRGNNSFFLSFFESLLSHKINNHISYVTTLKEGIYINYRENQDKNYKTRLCL